MKKLLIVVDMQKDFIDGALGTEEARAILPAVAARIDRARAENCDILFTRDTHDENYLSSAEGKKLPVVHCVQNSEGWQIDKSLNTDGAEILDKPSFGSAMLGGLVEKRNYDEIELIGLCTDICVISNALLVKAFLPQARVCVRRNCCAGVTPESHENALKAMAACQIDIL